MIIRSIYLFLPLILALSLADHHRIDQVDVSYHINLDQEKCMEDLGCFKLTKDFYDTFRRPVNVLPQDREIIDTRFKLYQRDAPAEYKKLNTYRREDLRNSTIDVSKETKIIVHGWLDEDFGPWQERLKDRILLNGDYNVIIVDWTKGNKPPYTQATANTRVVGAEIALLVNRLKEEKNLDPRKVHIIGHSLGAQIAGYAGQLIKELARITGLDPAQPYYEGMPRSVRLDETDAEFVDIIHTDSVSILMLGFGVKEPCGHVDFYPNNGRDQPGCKKSVNLIKIITEGIKIGGSQLVGCNHHRSVQFYTDTVTQTRCVPVGYKCSSWSNFLEGKCTDCGRDGSGCAILGEKAHLSKGLGQNNLQLYLVMGKDRPYCIFHYKVIIKLHKVKDSQKTKGRFQIEIHGEDGDASQSLSKDDVDLVPNTQHVFLFTTPNDLGNIQSIALTWKTPPISILNPLNWFKKPKINVKYIQLVPMNVIDKSEKLAQTKTFCQADPDKPIYPDKASVHVLSEKCKQ